MQVLVKVGINKEVVDESGITWYGYEKRTKELTIGSDALDVKEQGSNQDRSRRNNSRLSRL
jgi:hypothetical protein